MKMWEKIALFCEEKSALLFSGNADESEELEEESEDCDNETEEETEEESNKVTLLEKLFEQEKEKYRQSVLKELREKELNLDKRWAKSNEYRLMLMEYQEKLKKREQELNDREKELTDRETALQEETARKLDEIRAQHVENKLELSKKREEQKEYIRSLRQTEIMLIEWMRRVDKKERQAMAELSVEKEKLNSHPVLVDNGYDFEEFVAEMLKKKGYQEVEVTQKSQDFGADIVAFKDGIKHVVQCKYYSSAVGIEAVQQIFAAKEHYGAHVAVVATNNVYTKAAKTLAAELKVVL